MAFWSSADVEPKRNYKFRVTFTNLSANNAGSVIWWAKTVSKPVFSVSEVEHDHFDNKYYFPGRVTWEDLSLTLVDPVSVNATGQVMGFLTALGYNVPANDGDKVLSVNKGNGTRAVGSIIIEVYGGDAGQQGPGGGVPGGTVLEKWTLNNAWVKTAKFGDLDYSSDELTQIELTIRYDWASFE